MEQATGCGTRERNRANVVRRSQGSDWNELPQLLTPNRFVWQWVDFKARAVCMGGYGLRGFVRSHPKRKMRV